jgi:hypothetical protein
MKLTKGFQVNVTPAADQAGVASQIETQEQIMNSTESSPEEKVQAELNYHYLQTVYHTVYLQRPYNR